MNDSRHDLSRRTAARVARLLAKTCFIGLSGLLAQHALAEACLRGRFSDSASPTAPSSITAARDAYERGTPVGSGALTDVKTNVLYTDCTPSRVTATAIGTPIPGVAYVLDGRSHPVFQTGVPGIGFAVMANVGWTSYYAQWKALDLNETALDISGIDPGKWWTQFRVALVFGGPLQTGSHSSPQTPIATFRVYRSDGLFDTRTITLSSFTTNVTTRGCSLSSPVTTSVSLAQLVTYRLRAIGDVSDTAGTTSLQIKCTGAVNVYATMTDVANPTNTGDALSLRAGSSAQGVGLKLYRQGNADPIAFGPDSSAKGNTNQWFVGKVQDGSLSIPLSARYVKAAQHIVPGSANFAATFTFSYQ
ncbi:MAG: fimbrial protein [Burkholderia cenocepacia]